MGRACNTTLRDDVELLFFWLGGALGLPHPLVVEAALLPVMKGVDKDVCH